MSGIQPLLESVEWPTASAMLFNYFSSISIVYANKLLMDSHHFHFATTLTFLHFLFTSLGLLLLSRIGLFKIKPLDSFAAAKLAAAGMGFVVFSNLSLQANSIGFYQVMKHMTVVAVVTIEFFVFRKPLHRALWLPLTLVVVGISISGATDFRLNTRGTIFAIANILCTAFYQIWCGALQKSLDASSLQLQMYTAPFSALFIIPAIPFFDTYIPKSSPDSIFNYPSFTPEVGAMIAATCALALCVNVSIYMVIGKTSAVTYNILGHFKTCTLLLADFLLFGRPVEPINVASIAVTLVGVAWYSHATLRLKAAKQAEQVS